MLGSDNKKVYLLKSISIILYLKKKIFTDFEQTDRQIITNLTMKKASNPNKLPYICACVICMATEIVIMSYIR